MQPQRLRIKTSLRLRGRYIFRAPCREVTGQCRPAGPAKPARSPEEHDELVLQGRPGRGGWQVAHVDSVGHKLCDAFQNVMGANGSLCPTAGISARSGTPLDQQTRVRATLHSWRAACCE